MPYNSWPLDTISKNWRCIVLFDEESGLNADSTQYYSSLVKAVNKP